MTYLIPKASMHPVERWAVLVGLILLSLGATAVGMVVDVAAPLTTAWTLMVTLALVFNPADRMEYLLEPDGLRVGGMAIPIAALKDVRMVRLDGTLIYLGLASPGCWAGRAWSHRLGRFQIRGSTGLGKGVMLTLNDGRRIVITPREPVALVVHLQILLHRRSAPSPAASH